MADGLRRCGVRYLVLTAMASMMTGFFVVALMVNVPVDVLLSAATVPTCTVCRSPLPASEMALPTCLPFHKTTTEPQAEHFDTTRPMLRPLTFVLVSVAS